MNAKHLLFPLLLSGLSTVSSTIQAKGIRPETASEQHLCFVENKGQVTDQRGNSRYDINYRLGGSGLESMFIGKGQLHYQWASPAAQLDSDNKRIALYRMDVTLVGADPQAKVVAEQKQDYFERYYTAQFGEEGAKAYAYQKITYQNVYPNIDWMLYVKDNKVEYDFVVHPGSRVSDIRLRYDGATNLSLDATGRLTATTPAGNIIEAAPLSYQQDGKHVASSFTLNGNIISFSTADYSGTLVIDPTLSWSTYYGGSGTETMKQGCVAGDAYGYGYLGGATNSSTLATIGSYQDTVTGGNDAFLVKFNNSGVRQWATYFGGSGSETVYGISCDRIGNIYLSGYTNSTDMLTTVGAYQTTNNGNTDALLAKFDSSGAIQWSTYFGGSAAEQCYGIACDSNNNVYITGATQSTSSIASIGAYQSSEAGSQDGFLAKFNSVGTFKWATYYGGAGLDNGYGVSCDDNNNVFIGGLTKSTSGIATIGSYQATLNGTQDAFVAKFDSTGGILWGTYYGGPGLDAGGAIICDDTGSVYITGNTASTSGIATIGAVQDTFAGGAGDMFLAKFDKTGTLKWGTYYGGTGSDIGYALSYSKLGYVYLSGVTPSNGLATVGSYQDTVGGSTDALLVKFDTTGSRIWATYFGAEAADYGHGVYCNGLSEVFLGGASASYGLNTTVGCYQGANAGGSYDGYLVMFNDCVLTEPDTLIGHDTVCRSGLYTYYIPMIAGAISYTWTLPVGWTGSSITDTIHVVAGTQTDTMKVAANFACGTSTQLTKVIIVSSLPTITPVGTLSICNGDSVTISASTGTAYQWLQAGLIIVGANGSSYNAHTGNHYSVIVTSSNGCADTSAADTVIVHPTPVPVITTSGMTLNTGTYTSYQWNRNGTPITGAINQTYTMVIDSGNYTVTVVDSNGCTGTSAIYNPTEGVTTINANNLVDLYPNPTTGIVYISSTQQVNVTVTDVEGKLIATYKEAKQIDLSGFSDGIYLLRLTNKEGLISIQKMVKAKTQ